MISTGFRDRGPHAEDHAIVHDQIEDAVFSNVDPLALFTFLISVRATSAPV
jgi:hypothetical protein